MDIRKLQRAIVDGLEDVKAQDILVFNTEHLSPLFERVIIATGSSNRQTKALASGVREAVRAAGFPVLATEGADNGEWIIVDCGAAVAHVMQPAIRTYYRLEEIWGGKPVKMKLGAATTGLVKASEPDDGDAPAMAPERKAAARKGVAAKQGPARVAVAQKLPAKPGVSNTVARPAANTAANTAAKAAAKKAAPRKPVAAKAAPVKTIVVKPGLRQVASAKKAAATKVAGARAPARKAPARRG